MEEYIARVGQQAAVIYCTPGKSQHQPHYYKVVGSQPLQNIVSSNTAHSLWLDTAEIDVRRTGMPGYPGHAGFGVVKVKEADLYSAFTYTQVAQVLITQCYLQITLYLPLPRKHSPDGASQTEVADI